jgi:hypothetical protein
MNAITLKISSYVLLQRVGLHVDSIVTGGHTASIFRLTGLNSLEYYIVTLKMEATFLSKTPESVCSYTLCSKQEDDHLHHACPELKSCE